MKKSKTADLLSLWMKTSSILPVGLVLHNQGNKQGYGDVFGKKAVNSGRYTPKVVDVFLSATTITSLHIQGVYDIVVDVVDKMQNLIFIGK